MRVAASKEASSPRSLTSPRCVLTRCDRLRSSSFACARSSMGLDGSTAVSVQNGRTIDVHTCQNATYAVLEYATSTRGFEKNNSAISTLAAEYLALDLPDEQDRKSTRLNSSHLGI